MVVYNLHRREAVLEDGTVVPITNMLDTYGEFTNEPSECVCFICGTEGHWRAVDVGVDGYDNEKVH